MQVKDNSVLRSPSCTFYSFTIYLNKYCFTTGTRIIIVYNCITVVGVENADVLTSDMIFVNISKCNIE